jgi:hypothetical protein
VRPISLYALGRNRAQFRVEIEPIRLAPQRAGLKGLAMRSRPEFSASRVIANAKRRRQSETFQISPRSRFRFAYLPMIKSVRKGNEWASGALLSLAWMM